MKPLLILGTGGHAKVLVELLLAAGCKVAGLIDKVPAKNTHLLGVAWLGGDEDLSRFTPTDFALVNGLGKVDRSDLRAQIFERNQRLGYEFPVIQHPSVIVAREVKLGKGVQLMAGSVVQVGATLGDNTIVNTRAAIDHDCHIGAHVHIAPGVTLSGDVRVGDGTLIGAGACVIQGVCIGKNVVVGAGSTITQDIPDGVTVVGFNRILGSDT